MTTIRTSTSRALNLLRRLFTVPLFPNLKDSLALPLFKIRHRALLHQPGTSVRRIHGMWRICFESATMTPFDAMRANLALVCDVLVKEGIPYFVVRNDTPNRFRIGIREDHREAVGRALAAAHGRSGVYLRAGRQEEALARAMVADAIDLRPFAETDAWRINKYFVSPNGSLVLGALHGCDIDFWRKEDDGTLVAGRLNKIAARIPPPLTEPGRFDIRGVTHPSLRAFTDHPHIDDVRFPVDLVYTWVDGDDPSWQASKEAALARARGGGGSPDRLAVSQARFRNRDELRYSLRSVEMYAEWVRMIYLVTADQTPEWLDTSHPKIRVISHRDIFRDVGNLPTFNSHAIASMLHHIEGLAEHFVYMNDDVFFGRVIDPSLMFASNGVARVFYSGGRTEMLAPPKPDDAIVAAHRNVYRLLFDTFGRVAVRRFMHGPHPVRRSVMAELEERFPDAFADTASHPFRDPGDISAIGMLHHHYALLTGRAQPGPLHFMFMDLARANTKRRMERVARREYDSFCLNEKDTPASERERVDAMVADFLERYFPMKSTFER